MVIKADGSDPVRDWQYQRITAMWKR